MSFVIGITGGICSGKSSAASFLNDHFKQTVIDFDKLGHATYVPHSDTYNELVKVFGHDILVEKTFGNEIDRKALGGMVFGNAVEMKKLTDIVWPGIHKLAEQEISKKKEEKMAFVMVEAAVLIEAGWTSLCDEIWCIVVDPKIAIERLMKRNNLSEDQAKARLAAQITNDERAEKSNLVIENNGSKVDFEKKVCEAFENLKTKNKL